MYSFKKLILLCLIKCHGNVFHEFISDLWNSFITPLLLLQVLPFTSPKWLLFVFILREINSLWPASPTSLHPFWKTPGFSIFWCLHSGIFLFMRKLRCVKETNFLSPLMMATCPPQLLEWWQLWWQKTASRASCNEDRYLKYRLIAVEGKEYQADSD